MSWWEYVVQTSGTDSPKAMQAITGVDSPNFSRWKAGHVPKADMVADFARAYGRPVLEAFIAARFLTAEEARERPSAAPSLDTLEDEQLLDEIRRRMRHVQAEEAPKNQAPGSGADGNVTELPAAAYPKTGRQSSGRRQAQRHEQLGEESQDSGTDETS